MELSAGGMRNFPVDTRRGGVPAAGYQPGGRRFSIVMRRSSVAR